MQVFQGEFSFFNFTTCCKSGVHKQFFEELAGHYYFLWLSAKVATCRHVYRAEPKEPTTFGSVSGSEMQNLPFSHSGIVSARTKRTNLIWFCIWFGDTKSLYRSQPYLLASTKFLSSRSLSSVLNDWVTTSAMLTRADKFSLSCVLWRLQGGPAGFITGNWIFLYAVWYIIFYFNIATLKQHI